MKYVADLVALIFFVTSVLIVGLNFVFTIFAEWLSEVRQNHDNNFAI